MTELVLDAWEVELLTELLTDRLEGVKSGEICGYGQPREAEVNDTQLLLDKLTGRSA